MNSKGGMIIAYVMEEYLLSFFFFFFSTGIVYVFSQKDAEVVSTELQKNGILAQPYHANMEPSDKTLVHRQWSSKKIQVQPLINSLAK